MKTRIYAAPAVKGLNTVRSLSTLNGCKFVYLVVSPHRVTVSALFYHIFIHYGVWIAAAIPTSKWMKITKIIRCIQNIQM